MPPRVLCILRKSPLPDTTGSRRRHLRLTTALASAFEVRVIIAGPTTEDEREALGAMPNSVEVLQPAPRRATPRERALWLAGAEPPLDLLRCNRRALSHDVSRAVMSHGADLIWASGPVTASLVDPALRIPLVVDLAHAEAIATRRELEARFRALRSRPAELRHLIPAFIDRRARIAREAHQVGRASLVTAVSDDELAAVRGPSPRRTAVIPNGLDLPATLGWSPGSARLLFVGNLHYRPNREAAEHLINKILPLLRAARPDLTLDIVGAGATRLDTARIPPGVQARGFVDSLDELYRSAELVIAPLQAGSGTKLKVLEAFGHGVPVVTTPIGVEGLGVSDGAQVRVGETDQQLVRAALDLLGDSSMAERQRLSARSFVEGTYEWSTIGADLASSMLELLD